MSTTSPTGRFKKGYARVNGTELYYEDSCSSFEPIVFSHALLLDSSLFYPQAELLSDHFRCISYDHRGQGKSAEHSSNAISIDLLTDDLIALIRELNLGKVHFCGLSMGGFVGIKLAARCPELVKSLILIGSSAEAESGLNLYKYRSLNFLSKHFGPASVARAVAPIIYGKSTLGDPSRTQAKIVLIDQLGSNR